MEYQTTLRDRIAFEGVGLHTGVPCKVEVVPAPPGTGLRFTVDDRVTFPALAEYVVETARATVPASRRPPRGTTMSRPIPVPTRLWRVAGALALAHLVLMFGGFALEPEAPYEMRTTPGGMGCEDPRVTYIPILRRYVMAYTAFGPQGPRIAVALSSDEETAEGETHSAEDTLQVTSRSVVVLRRT